MHLHMIGRCVLLGCHIECFTHNCEVYIVDLCGIAIYAHFLLRALQKLDIEGGI